MGNKDSKFEKEELKKLSFRVKGCITAAGKEYPILNLKVKSHWNLI